MNAANDDAVSEEQPNKPSGEVPWKVTIVFYMMGICIMLPWNFFITADPYWQYKLRNTTLEDNWNDAESDLTKLQVSFTPALVIISNLTCFLFFFATSAIAKRISEKTRILGSLGLSLGAMCIITLFSVINTDSWQGAFFWITLFLVAILNIGIAVLQASLFGMTGFFPITCMTSFMSGQSVAGIMSSLSQIIALALGDADPITTGIIYFSIADIILIITMITYFNFANSEYYINVKLESQNKDAIKQTMTSWSEYFMILKKVFKMGFTFGFVMVVTLSVFPAVQVYVTSSLAPSIWTDVYFQPTITFLFFNIFDMCGREILRWIQWPSFDGWGLHILGVSRIIFIPLILLCNGTNKSFPTVFYNDAWYIAINILFAFSNGYIVTLASMYYPKFVSAEETEIAGTIMASLLGIGMIIGSALSPAFVAIWGPSTS